MQEKRSGGSAGPKREARVLIAFGIMGTAGMALLGLVAVGVYQTLM